jgi:hypothetical protein
VQCNRATYASLMHTRTHPSFFFSNFNPLFYY